MIFPVVLYTCDT